MPTASSRILLLGWNEALPPQPAAAPSLRDLVKQLAPLTSLSVLLPHEPRPAFAGAAGAHVTGLAEQDLAALLTAPPLHPGSAAWQVPAAPYVGSAATPRLPPAPYQGASAETAAPAAVAPPVAPTPPPAPVDLLNQSAATTGAPVAAETPLARPPAAGDFAPVEARPDFATSDSVDLPSGSPVADAQSLQQPAEPAAVVAVAADAMALITALPPPPPTRVHATLAQELAALGRNPPNATAADLNFQVIQYARFASSWARSRQFAVIYAVDWLTWLAAMEIRQLTGWPLVLHVHNLAQERAAASETGWAAALERLALRRADLVLAASTELAERLTERYQLPPERLRTVATTDSVTINELLLHIKPHRPGRPTVDPITPFSA